MPVMKIDKTKKPYYWSEAINHLSKHDPILSNLITQHKSCEVLKSTNNPFVTFFKIRPGWESLLACEKNINKTSAFLILLLRLAENTIKPMVFDVTPIETLQN